MPAKTQTPVPPRPSLYYFHPAPDAYITHRTQSLREAENFVRSAPRRDMTVQEWEVPDREGRPLRIVRVDVPRTEWWEGWPDHVFEFTAWHALVGQV